MIDPVIVSTDEDLQFFTELFPSHISTITVCLELSIDDTNPDDHLGQLLSFSALCERLYKMAIRLPETIRVYNIEIDLGESPNITLNTILNSLANFQVAYCLRSLLDNGWSTCSRVTNFVWRHASEVHGDCAFDPEHILIKLPSAFVQSNNNQGPARFSETEIEGLTTRIENLLRSGIITSHWDIY